MADDLALKYNNLSLDDEANSIIDLARPGEEVSSDKVALMLVERLVTDRSSNVDAFIRTMIHSWGFLIR